MLKSDLNLVIKDHRTDIKVMNRLQMWMGINRYLMEGVITPIRGDYIIDKKDKTFQADLIGSMILTYIGPTKFGVNEMPAIEPGVVSGLIKIYSPRELALLECAYEGKTFEWSNEYLSETDLSLLADFYVNGWCPPISAIRDRYKWFVKNLVKTSGDIEIAMSGS